MREYCQTLISHSNKAKKKCQVPKREPIVGNVGGRVTMAQRGATSVRAQFHNMPVELRYVAKKTCREGLATFRKSLVAN